MSVRKAGRELALQMLFSSCFYADTFSHDAGLKVLETTEADPETTEFARHLYNGTIENLNKIDELIKKKLENWNIDRLHNVDKSIIRLAVFELTEEENETPPSVVIDQAVRIAKKFGGEESGRFVNGILGAIYRMLFGDDKKKSNV